ncbi:MAG: type II secretion system F family protein [Chloroflexi bacterium]|nr:type II secretion system F family protein [Chloroflexota bacterium]
MHVLLSLALGSGLYLVFRSLTGGPRSAGPRSGRRGRRLGWAAHPLAAPGSDGVGLRELAPASAAGAAAGGALAQLLFGWPVVTLAAAGTGLLLPGWYYRQRALQRRAEVEEAVGEAVEMLRDAVRIGLGIEEALRALAQAGPTALRPVLEGMERDFRLAGFEEGLERARERLQEPLFDTLAVALLTAYRIGGRNLAAVLDGLSHSIRGTVQVRREVRAQQAQNVLSARVIAALPVVLILVIRGSNPNYLAAFSEPAGQAVLACCLLSVFAGYTVMLRQASLPGRERVLR